MQQVCRSLPFLRSAVRAHAYLLQLILLNNIRQLRATHKKTLTAVNAYRGRQGATVDPEKCGMENKPSVFYGKGVAATKVSSMPMTNILLAIGVACALMAVLIIVNSAVGLPCHLRAICDR